jgi:hypothetical protein
VIAVEMSTAAVNEGMQCAPAGGAWSGGSAVMDEFLVIAGRDIRTVAFCIAHG